MKKRTGNSEVGVDVFVLSACPFCGGAAEIHTHIREYDNCNSVETYFGVGCKTGTCHGCYDSDMAYYKNRENAATAWNKRA